MNSLWKDDPQEFMRIDKLGAIPPNLLDKYPTLHWCAEWDWMLVDGGCPEFDVCICEIFGKRLRGESD